MKKNALRCGSPDCNPTCDRVARYKMTLYGGITAGGTPRAWCRRCTAKMFKARGFSYGFELLDRDLRRPFRILLEKL